VKTYPIPKCGVVRIYAAILAGANRLRPLDFVIYNATGGLVWATVFGLGGYLVGKNIQHFLGPIGWVAFASFAVGGYFLWSFYKSHEARLLAEAERALAARKAMHWDV
jgi:membrane protein DedA with SNARE-associated domain